MPIKSRPVDPKRAAAVARGQMGTEPSVSAAQKNYFYYEGVKRQEERNREGDDEVDDSSSLSSSRSISLSQSSSRKPQEPQQEAGPARSRLGNAVVQDDTSDDEEVLAAARERTRQLLYPESDARYVQKPYSNARLAAYEQNRQQREQENETRQHLQEAHQSETREPMHQQAVAVPEPELHDRFARDSEDIVSEASSTDVAAAQLRQHQLQQELLERQRATRSAAEATENDPVKRDFYRLLSLLEDDVLADWAAADVQSGPLIASAAMPSAVGRDGEVKQQRGTYRPPARTFAQLQDEALQQLYEDWNNKDEGGTGNAKHSTDAFIATEHAATAFTLATAMCEAQQEQQHSLSQNEAPQRRTSGGGGGGGFALMDAPFTMEEIALAERTRRNEAAGFTSSAGAFSSPTQIAFEAQEQLTRFLHAVEWVERLVRDSRFIQSIAAFLYEHHRIFMRHASADARESGVDTMVEHSHEEYAVYEEFGRRVSDVLLRLLQAKVRGFDETEFVEALYDTPVAGRDEYNYPNAESDVAGDRGPQNVLSYPSWRIILAMSHFESFSAWVLEYIQEEYRVGGGEHGAVAVAGARGVRALIRSTYSKQETTQAPFATEDELEEAATIMDPPLAGISGANGGGSFSTPSAAVQPRLSCRSESSPTSAAGGQVPLSLSLGGSTQLAPNQWSLSASGVRESSSTTQSASFASPGKFFPTPPASADGRLGKKKPAARVGRNLPPISMTPDEPSITTNSVETTDLLKAEKRPIGRAKRPTLATKHTVKRQQQQPAQTEGDGAPARRRSSSRTASTKRSRSKTK